MSFSNNILLANLQSLQTKSCRFLDTATTQNVSLEFLASSSLVGQGYDNVSTGCHCSTNLPSLSLMGQDHDSVSTGCHCSTNLTSLFLMGQDYDNVSTECHCSTNLSSLSLMGQDYDNVSTGCHWSTNLCSLSLVDYAAAIQECAQDTCPVNCSSVYPVSFSLHHTLCVSVAGVLESRPTLLLSLK